MRDRYPFRRDDLRELAELLDRAEEVVAMREIAAGELHPNVIGLRHDVDNVLEPCLELSDWESRRGYRATYFVLHDSPYWNDPVLPGVLEVIASRGHEIGIHVNAIAEALRTGGDPDRILEAALARLRGWGHNVIGAAAHGEQPTCAIAHFVNDEMFEECARPEYGDPDRVLALADVRLRLRPRPLSDYGLEYDTYRIGRRELYLSDSGGEWAAPGFEAIRDAFPAPDGQLHILQHPCWWLDAFPVRAEVPA